ncbi:MAG: lysophospholipid acyltransferase family protein [Ilyomonas sp.]
MRNTLGKNSRSSSTLFVEIFARIWALWGLVTWIVTILIAFIFFLPCYLMKEPMAARWHRRVSRVWIAVYLTLIGCSLKVKGKANYDKKTNYIVVCNHNSFMDILATTPYMPNANKTIAKKSLSYIPVFGWIYSMGSILVDRKDTKSRQKSYVEMKEVLRLGLDMVIYPEGTRNRTNEPLKNFYDGAFRLSVDTGKPIIPAAIFNTRKVFPATKIFYLMPHKMEMHFLPPLYPDNYSAKEMKEQIFKQMWDYLEINS